MAKLKKQLSLFDTTSIVIGSIVGADIYIASAITAGMIGPFSIFVWMIAGIMAMLLAMVFAYCSFYCPKVGGPFAFVSTALDDFYGFLAGWGLWIAEIAALAVFPVAFTNYLQFFIPLDFFQQILVKCLFILGLTSVNIIGIRAAGVTNDVLTLVKLCPLILLIIMGFSFFVFNPSTLASNYSPLSLINPQNFGSALVLIIWAYAGFELATLPASEIKNPRKTLPKAIILGMIFVLFFYLLTNFVVYGVVNWQTLSQTNVPLVLAGIALMGGIGAIIMSLGALVSVSGSDESGVLGTARLSYAMSIDGLFPRIFSKIHKKYGTPYMALMIQAIIAFIASSFSGITNLITFSMFTLSFSYFLTCVSLIVLKRRQKNIKLFGQSIIPLIGIAICFYLLWSTGFYEKIVGALIILSGIPIYVFFSPKVDMHHLKKLFVSEENILERKLAYRHRFLANFLRIVHRVYKRMIG